jgi:hypothetical protein
VTIGAGLQRLVWQRAHDRCEYCQLPAEVAWLPFQIDHIIPEKLHGQTVPENLALSCEHCNSHKGALAAGCLGGKHVPLFHPRKDRWSDHFEWNGALLSGKTDVGNVTIDVLAINRADRVAVRRSLIEEGVVPPRE